ncbi:MAG: glycoside hydrolase family 25 protein [Erysipelotrichaceae bacterium]|nr:glycoside hydrolase family 25 protein [Erysipelotrichaceae bacterium]
MFDGIDVSQYQGDIDWEKVKNHIDYAILRCGYGQDILAQDDPTFKRNADECTRLNIPFGVYLYSYATDEKSALSEARHILRLVAGYQLDYPVYLDLEDPRIGRLTNEQIERNCRAWVDEMEKNNYYSGFYASYYWWTSKLTGALFSKYTKWVARYADELGTQGYQMWQYTDNGFVEGINAPVDRDICYVDFSKIIDHQASTIYKVGDHVTFNHVFISSDSTVPLIPYMNHGTITKIEPNARNPYLIGEGLGWINNESIISNDYLSNSTYKGDSLVEALKQIGYDTTFESRKKLAQLNGINDYTGTAKQNLELLQLLKIGQLKQ